MTQYFDFDVNIGALELMGEIGDKVIIDADLGLVVVVWGAGE